MTGQICSHAILYAVFAVEDSDLVKQVASVETSRESGVSGESGGSGDVQLNGGIQLSGESGVSGDVKCQQCSGSRDVQSKCQQWRRPDQWR